MEEATKKRHSCDEEETSSTTTRIIIYDYDLATVSSERVRIVKCEISSLMAKKKPTTTNESWWCYFSCMHAWVNCFSENFCVLEISEKRRRRFFLEKVDNNTLEFARMYIALRLTTASLLRLFKSNKFSLLLYSTMRSFDSPKKYFYILSFFFASIRQLTTNMNIRRAAKKIVFVYCLSYIPSEHQRKWCRKKTANACMNRSGDSKSMRMENEFKK